MAITQKFSLITGPRGEPILEIKDYQSDNTSSWVVGLRQFNLLGLEIIEATPKPTI